MSRKPTPGIPGKPTGFPDFPKDDSDSRPKVADPVPGAPLLEIMPKHLKSPEGEVIPDPLEPV